MLCQALGHSSNTATICRAKVQRGRTAMNAKRMLWGCTTRLWGTFLQELKAPEGFPYTLRLGCRATSIPSSRPHAAPALHIMGCNAEKLVLDTGSWLRAGRGQVHCKGRMRHHVANTEVFLPSYAARNMRFQPAVSPKFSP